MRKFVLSLVLVSAVACSTREEQLVNVVRQGRALLRHPPEAKVRDAEWEARRAKFLLNSELVAPTTTRSQ